MLGSPVHLVLSYHGTQIQSLKAISLSYSSYASQFDDPPPDAKTSVDLMCWERKDPHVKASLARIVSITIMTIDNPTNCFVCSLVIVWDKPHADRTKVPRPGFNAPFFTFAGEMLDAQPPGPTQETLVKVQGNCFACHAWDVEDVKQKMRSTSYYKEVSFSIALIVIFLTQAFIRTSGIYRQRRSRSWKRCTPANLACQSNHQDIWVRRYIASR
jgi:hypothetical protein